MSRGVVALTYHGFGVAADPGAGARAAVPVAELEAQLEVIAAAGGAMDPRRATTGDSGIVLTFDDGERSVLAEALPRLERRGWVGAVFVTTGWIGRPGYLTAADLRRLRREGWLVGAHGGQVGVESLFQGLAKDRRQRYQWRRSTRWGAR